MKRTISTRLTFIYKFVIPIPWIIWISIALPKTISRLSAQGGESIKSWILICIWIVGSAALFWFCKTLKKVVIDYSGKLLVSNYLQVIAVRPEDIAHIADGTDFFHPIVIWFTLRQPDTFGGKIIFMPLVSTVYYSPHPVLKELQDFVSLAKERAGG